MVNPVTEIRQRPNPGENAERRPPWLERAEARSSESSPIALSACSAQQRIVAGALNRRARLSRVMIPSTSESRRLPISW